MSILANEGKAGIVYVCGDCEHGQLGLPLVQLDGGTGCSGTQVPSSGPRIVGRRELAPIPVIDENGLVSSLTVLPKLRSQRIAAVAAGGDHSFAISASGRVFAFGKNDAYQLGISAGNHVYQAASARIGLNVAQEGADDRCIGPEPLQVSNLRWKQIIEIACGEGHSLARSAKGAVYAWGMGAGGRLGLGHYKTVQQPTKISALENIQCSKISAGYYHSMALTDNGELYAWGSGDGGQLGTGRPESSPVPALVKSPPDVMIWRDISAGEYHSAAIADGGGLYSWGLNSYGQLGHGDLDRRVVPFRIMALMGTRVTLLACGQSFTLALSSSGETLCWGHNVAGQLGLGDRVERHLPTAIVTLRGVRLVRLACGGRFAAALDHEGALWTWGDNAGGCLGHGDGDSRLVPTRVVESRDLGLEQLACGHGHMLVASGVDLGEVQSRDFFLQGLVHMDEPLEPGFCIYKAAPDASFRPLSVALDFHARHGVAISPDPIVLVDPSRDARLREILARLECLAARADSRLERVRLLAMGVYYELGGAQARLEAASQKHLAGLVQRGPFPSLVVPLGSVRVGDARLRAALLKLACDRVGVACCMVRGAVPVADGPPGFMDLTLCSERADYADWHVWNMVRLEQEACYLVDLVGIPTELRRIENSAQVLEQLGPADRDMP